MGPRFRKADFRPDADEHEYLSTYALMSSPSVYSLSPVGAAMHDGGAESSTSGKSLWVGLYPSDQRQNTCSDRTITYFTMVMAGPGRH